MSQSQRELQEARAECQQARELMNAEKPGSKQWIAAEENLNWWQGRKAFLEAYAE